MKPQIKVMLVDNRPKEGRMIVDAHYHFIPLSQSKEILEGATDWIRAGELAGVKKSRDEAKSIYQD